MMSLPEQVASWKPRLAAAAFALIGMMVADPVPAEQPAPAASADPALAKKDHHLTVDANLYPWSSVGKIFNSVGGACTGFVVAPDKVVTAGHCVYAFRTHRFLPPDAIHFLLGYDHGDYRIHARVAHYRLGPGYDPNNEKGTAAADWAVLDLVEPLPPAIRPLAPRTDGLSRGAKVMIGGFARDRAFVMTCDKDCRILDLIQGGKLLSHDCLTAPGDSGAPVLIATADNSFAYLGVTIANWRIGDKQTGIAAAAADLILNDTAAPGVPSP